MSASKTGGGRGTNQYAVRGRSQASKAATSVPAAVSSRLKAQADAAAGLRVPITASAESALRWAYEDADDALNEAFNPGNSPRAFPLWVAHDDHGPLTDGGSPSAAVRAAHARVTAGHAARIVIWNDDDGSNYMPFDTNVDGVLAVVADAGPNHYPCNRCGADTKGASAPSGDDCDRCRTDIEGPDEADLDDYDDINTVELAAARREIGDARGY